MKIPFRDIEPFVKSPNPAIRAILVYGPDSGLMRERATIMAKTIVPDLTDPFNVALLSPDILKDDPARLTDEANAISMMGGRRLIRIENADDKITTPLKTYLENPNDNAVIILEAANLTPRSSLRKLCEKEKNTAAIPCYVEDERDLAKFIRAMLHENNLQIEPDAVAWLAVNIAGNRQKTRAELEKLVIYKGEDKAPITTIEAQNCCGEAGARNLDDLIYATAGNNRKKALESYNQLMEDGVAFMVVLRSLQNHFRRLHITKSKMDEGESLEIAMKSLTPPIFFKQADSFKSQLRNWRTPSLQKVMHRLQTLEADCKKTGFTPETLCAQAVLGISSMRG